MVSNVSVSIYLVLVVTKYAPNRQWNKINSKQFPRHFFYIHHNTFTQLYKILLL